MRTIQLAHASVQLGFILLTCVVQVHVPQYGRSTAGAAMPI